MEKVFFTCKKRNLTILKGFINKNSHKMDKPDAKNGTENQGLSLNTKTNR